MLLEVHIQWNKMLDVFEFPLRFVFWFMLLFISSAKQPNLFYDILLQEILQKL